MKRIISYFSLIAAILFASCSDLSIEMPEDGVRVDITLRSHNSPESKAAGDAENVESLINTIDCYFFTGNTSSATAVLHIRKENVTVENNKIQDFYLTSAQLNTIFPVVSGTQATTAYLYVLANTETPVVSGDLTVANIKQCAVESDFSSVQTSFVMDSQSSKITLDSKNNRVSGAVELVRSAAKIVLSVNVSAEVSDSDSGASYKPDTQTIRAQLINSVKKGYIDNVLFYPVDENCFIPPVEKSASFSALVDPDNKKVKSYSASFPSWYSYPYKWDEGKEDQANYKETYIRLEVSWINVNDEDDVISTYYKIPVNKLGTEGCPAEQLLRDWQYNVSVEINMLGSISDEVVVYPTYMLLPWIPKPIDASLGECRYLVVDQNKYEINNEPAFTIPFASSHECTITVTRSKKDLTKVVPGDPVTVTLDEVKVTDSSNGYQSDKISYITVQNKLINVVGDDYDYVPYDFVITIEHKDNSSYREIIEVKQYPAMYIEIKPNTDFQEGIDKEEYTIPGGSITSDDEDYYKPSMNDKNGYMFVNGYTGSHSDKSYETGYKTVSNVKVQCFGSANGMSDNAGNKNPNMYLISTTVLPKDSEYIIGDPRVATPDTDLANATFKPSGNNSTKTVWVSAPSTNKSGSRTLENYYPTDVSKTKVIAPKFRVASSYSVVHTDYLTKRECVRRRCASYQEDGYPAGRWRMPTEAEVKYVVNLSAQGLIPMLYSNGTRYWCATGYVVPAAGGKTVVTPTDESNQGGSIRCVYDTWYWGDDPIKNRDTFTWGDEPLNL